MNPPPRPGASRGRWSDSRQPADSRFLHVRASPQAKSPHCKTDDAKIVPRGADQQRLIIFDPPPPISSHSVSLKVSQDNTEEARVYALKIVLERQDMKRKDAANEYSSSEDEDHYPIGPPSTLDKFKLTCGQEEYFVMLVDWEPLSHVLDWIRNPKKKQCFCPCGKHAQEWRSTHKKVSLVIDEADHNSQSCGQCFTPQGLIDHLKHKGELCILHFGTRMYIKKLLELTKNSVQRTPSSSECDRDVGGLILLNGKGPNSLPQKKSFNVQVPAQTLFVKHPAGHVPKGGTLEGISNHVEEKKYPFEHSPAPNNSEYVSMKEGTHVAGEQTGNEFISPLPPGRQTSPIVVGQTSKSYDSRVNDKIKRYLKVDSSVSSSSEESDWSKDKTEVDETKEGTYVVGEQKGAKFISHELLGRQTTPIVVRQTGSSLGSREKEKRKRPLMETVSFNSSSGDEDRSTGDGSRQKKTKHTPPRPIQPPSCCSKGEEKGHQRDMANKPRIVEKLKEVSKRSCEPVKPKCQFQAPVHAPVHVDHPKSKRQQIHDTSLALTDIDVAVGVGTNNYSHARHPGNIALNDGIIQALPAVSCIRGTERTQLVLSFITQLEVKGTRFLVESKEGSLFRLATVMGKIKHWLAIASWPPYFRIN